MITIVPISVCLWKECHYFYLNTVCSVVICILLFSDIDVIAGAVVRSVCSPFNIFVPYILPAATTQQCNAVVAFHIHFCLHFNFAHKLLHLSCVSFEFFLKTICMHGQKSLLKMQYQCPNEDTCQKSLPAWSKTCHCLWQASSVDEKILIIEVHVLNP